MEEEKRTLTFHRPGGDDSNPPTGTASQQLWRSVGGGSHTLKVKMVECVSQVDEAYGDARFEPLTRALEILGSINAEQELEVLREQWRDVDGMVDAVVEVHHEGFNTSLQNYSKIIQLLAEAQHYMHAVRKNLTLAQDNMNVDSRNLLEAYHKHAVASEMGKMMQQVQAMCQSLEQVDALDRDGDWNAAVKVLLETSNVLAREEIIAIPAVKGMVPKVRQRAGALLTRILRHVEGQAFRGVGATGFSSAWHQAHVSRRRKSRISRGSGFFGSGSGTGMRFIRFHSIVEDLQALDGKLRHARSPSVPIEGHVVDSGFGTSTSSISCIAQLGGVSKALNSVRAISRQKIRDAIVQVVNQNMSSRGVSSSAVSSDKAKVLLQKILMRCESIFRSVTKYIQHLIRARISAPSAGLALLSDGEDADAAYFDGQPGKVVADREINILWDNMQHELLHVVAAVLGLSVPQNEMDSDGLFIDMYWHNSKDVDAVSPSYVSRRRSADTRRTTLKYSLEEQLSEMSEEMASKAKTEGFSLLELEHLVKNAIGEEHCVVSSAPCITNPIHAFVTKCGKILDEVKREKEKFDEQPKQGKSSPGLLHSLYPRTSQSEKSAEPSVHILSSYIVEILRSDFVPSVYANCGHRTQELLSGLDNILTYARIHDTKSASILPAAETTVNLIGDMLKWSSLASIVAPNITGVLGNCLGKIVDSLQSHANGVCQDSLAFRLSQDVNVVHLMAQEPIATLVGGPEWFASAKSDAMESFLTSAIATGFAQGKTALPKSLVDAFLNARPLLKESLILQQTADMKSIVSIALLGNSADYIADGIYETVGSFVHTISPGKISGDISKTTTDVSSGNRQGDVSIDHELVVGLLHIADRFRSISGMCTRTLRIEAMLHVLYAMQDIFNPSQKVFDERIAMMAPKLASMDEVLAGYLLPTRREYIFAPLPGFCMKLAVFQLIEIEKLDSSTASSVCRALTGVEPVLGSLGLHAQQASKSTPMQSVTGIKPLHLAKKYYSLAVGGVENVGKALDEEKAQGRLTHDEWLVLSTIQA
ncbi:hypothetical protein M9434_006969 [Picochlorum sp. BPE23]|nr:hypothetical protein M9434_006969 [Picochlorum sp. BPE23]